MNKVTPEIIEYIQEEIKLLDEDLYQVQHSIWENPETCFEEHFAHDALTEFVSKQPGNWKIIKSAYDIKTAFVCTFTNSATASTPVISFNSEYDALPGIGHACGHNLIAVCGLTAALATALAMTKFNIAGTVKYFGTPAEEGGGGKILMIDAGAFKGVDVSLMAHPGGTKYAVSCIKTTACHRFKVEFFGKEAHAAANPYDGVNALDAMVLTYNAMAVLRQQLKPTDIVQCNISDGGKAANIITAHTEATFGCRAPTRGRMETVVNKVIACIQACALATGCKYKITKLTNYYDTLVNEELAIIYREFISTVFKYPILTLEQEKSTSMGASTDEGNVSWEVPSIQTGIPIINDFQPHNPGFTKAVGTKTAHKVAVEVGMTLAFTGLALLLDPKKLEKVKASFKRDLEENTIVSENHKPVETLKDLVYTD